MATLQMFLGILGNIFADARVSIDKTKLIFKFNHESGLYEQIINIYMYDCVISKELRKTRMPTQVLTSVL